MKKQLLFLFSVMFLLLIPSVGLAEEEVDINTLELDPKALEIETAIKRGEMTRVPSNLITDYYEDSNGNMVVEQEIVDPEEMALRNLRFLKNHTRVEGGYVVDEKDKEIYVYSMITKLKGINPEKITGVVKLQAGATKNGMFYDQEELHYTYKGKQIKKGFVKYSDPVKIHDTNFWRYTLNSSATWANGFTDSDYDVDFMALFNKKGIEYPKYKDEYSGIKMFMPDANLAWVPEKQRVKRDPRLAEKYQKWYERKYGIPPFDWDEVDIHHIIPLAYGGDNSMDNLIPLPKEFHRKTVTPWWRNYGKYVPDC